MLFSTLDAILSGNMLAVKCVIRAVEVIATILAVIF